MSVGLTADDIFNRFLDETDLSEEAKDAIATAIEVNNERLAKDLLVLIRNELNK
ncbi:hypothetical protein QIX46_08190 [Lysinibacillus boronitolerans]|nr:hypothetical protein QIX46_08190 [Lysinibacillus boronitolerans]